MSLISNTVTIRSVVAPSTALGTAAIALSARQASPLTGTIGFGTSLFNTSNGSISEYSGLGLWNPIRKQVHLIGDSHTPQVSKHVQYDDPTNTWSVLSATLPFQGQVAHSYHSVAVDTTTGDLYRHQHNGTIVYKYANSTQTWTTIASDPCAAPTISPPMVYFPTRNSLVVFQTHSSEGGIYEYMISSAQWFRRTSAQANMGPYSNQGTYDAVRDEVLFCMNNGTQGYRFNASGTLSSFNTGIPFKTAADGSGTLLTTDPVSGKAIAFTLTGAGYEFNGTTFVSTGYQLPAAFNVGAGAANIQQVMAVPISTYGVILLTGYQTQAVQYIYRHT